MNDSLWYTRACPSSSLLPVATATCNSSSRSRNEAGKPRQSTVATLGRVDEVGGGVNALLKGLLRAKGLPASAATPPELAFESALALGNRR